MSDTSGTDNLLIIILKNEEEIINKLFKLGTAWFLALYFVSAAFAGNISVPPGYAYFRGIAWNSIVHDALLRPLKKRDTMRFALQTYLHQMRKHSFHLKKIIRLAKLKVRSMPEVVSVFLA